MDTKQVGVTVPADVAERLRREAFEGRTSQGSIVADALRLHWEWRDCTCAADLDSHSESCAAYESEQRRINA